MGADGQGQDHQVPATWQHGVYSDAIALAAATGLSADIKAVRSYTGPPGVGVNFEQGITDTLGMLGRAATTLLGRIA